ncbi:hypothetical protein LX36DRAFT_723016 [Colletotrichum falcatum]|nr:hypothetical protein LX36DRAFT_723016 [Colletotrichum falcatum]
MHGSYYKRPVLSIDFDEFANGYSYNRPNRCRSIITSPRLMALGAFVTASSVLALVLFSVQQLNYKSPRITTCGNNPEEASRRGCLFESHNFAWTPPECYDDELNRKWDSQSWGYSRDPNGSDLIPQSEILKGNIEWAYVTLNQHLSHCVLIWQKYQRAVMFDRPADNWTTSFAHTYHCGHLMVQWNLDHDAYDSILYTKYVSCDYQWKTPDPRIQQIMNGAMDGGLIGDGGKHADLHGAGNIEEGHEGEHHL